jgi:hypothetical protein
MKNLKVSLFAILVGGIGFVGCQKETLIENEMAATMGKKAISLDLETGTGFIGKGDVQLLFGWNNKQLQDNAENLEFRVSSEDVREYEWTCYNSHNGNTQYRSQIISNSYQGTLSSIARVNKQITGFNISGYSEAAVVDSEVVSGNKINSCPASGSDNNNQNNWDLVSPGADLTNPSSYNVTGGLQVRLKPSGEWLNL